jgi:hypothetical protein
VLTTLLLPQAGAGKTLPSLRIRGQVKVVGHGDSVTGDSRVRIKPPVLRLPAGSG